MVPWCPMVQANVRQAIIRQITASVTFLPLLDEPCTFDLLIYTDRAAEVGIRNHRFVGLSENSVSHIPMDYHHVPHENCYLWVSPIFRQTHVVVESWELVQGPLRFAVICLFFFSAKWWLDDGEGDDDDMIGIWGRETEVPAIKVGILEKQSFRFFSKLEKGREAVGSWPIAQYLYMGMSKNGVYCIPPIIAI